MSATPPRMPVSMCCTAADAFMLAQLGHYHALYDTQCAAAAAAADLCAVSSLSGRCIAVKAVLLAHPAATKGGLRARLSGATDSLSVPRAFEAVLLARRTAT